MIFQKSSFTNFGGKNFSIFQISKTGFIPSLSLYKERKFSTSHPAVCNFELACLVCGCDCADDAQTSKLGLWPTSCRKAPHCTHLPSFIWPVAVFGISICPETTHSTPVGSTPVKLPNCHEGSLAVGLDRLCLC